MCLVNELSYGAQYGHNLQDLALEDTAVHISALDNSSELQLNSATLLAKRRAECL